MIDLKKSIIDDCKSLEPEAAAKKYEVAKSTISKWINGHSEPTAIAAQTFLNNQATGEVILTDKPQQTELTDWEGRELQVLLPVYRTFSWATHFTLFANYARYGAEKIGMIIEPRTVIHEARNRLVFKGLKSTSKKFLMVDDDMILPCGNPAVMNGLFSAGLPENLAGVNLISRLMSHKDRSVVGALYFGRSPNGKAQYYDAFEHDHINQAAKDLGDISVKKTKWVATGAMMIDRSVFERLKEAAPTLWPNIVPQNPETEAYGFFTPEAVGVGEDVSFCRRCEQIGIDIWVDQGCVCLHEGTRYFGAHNTRGQV